MGFSERHLHAIFATDLRDDAFHHQPEVLRASAYADEVARGIGSLLSRVKYASTLSHQFEDNDGLVAKLLREWLAIVTEKGIARKWIKTEDIPTIGHLAPAMYKRVADASLAHYLDGKCVECKGSGVTEARRICVPCKGSGEATIIGLSGHETKLALDMLSELMALESSHSGAASALLRRDE
jgi:hypothetical protein